MLPMYWVPQVVCNLYSVCVCVVLLLTKDMHTYMWIKVSAIYQHEYMQWREGLPCADCVWRRYFTVDGPVNSLHTGMYSVRILGCIQSAYWDVFSPHIGMYSVRIPGCIQLGCIQSAYQDVFSPPNCCERSSDHFTLLQ